MKLFLLYSAIGLMISIIMVLIKCSSKLITLVSVLIYPICCAINFVILYNKANINFEFLIECFDILFVLGFVIFIIFSLIKKYVTKKGNYYKYIIETESESSYKTYVRLNRCHIFFKIYLIIYIWFSIILFNMIGCTIVGCVYRLIKGR